VSTKRTDRGAIKPARRRKRNHRKAIYAVVLLVLLVALVVALSTSVMAGTTVTNAATSSSNNSGVVTPENAYTSNNVYADFDNGGDNVRYISYGFSIPAGATIQGIQVLVECNRD